MPEHLRYGYRNCSTFIIKKTSLHLRILRLYRQKSILGPGNRLLPIKPSWENEEEHRAASINYDFLYIKIAYLVKVSGCLSIFVQEVSN